MSLYSKDGWIDWNWIFQRYTPKRFPYIITFGGRGIGKTYGVLKYFYESGEQFGVMRRTQNELDLINTPEFSPFNKLNDDMGWNVETKPLSNYNGGFFDGDKYLGFTMALSTVSHMRGFDASKVKRVLYDEYIPEKVVSKMRGEGEALFNAYETMDRNRELRGEDPIQMILCANAFDISNAVFEAWELIEDVERMKRAGLEIMPASGDRGILLIDFFKSPISPQKGNTALYRAVPKNSEFYGMAVSNKFVGYNVSDVKPFNLSGLQPLFTLDGMTIYRTCGTKSEFYVTNHRKGNPPSFRSDIEGMKKLKAQFGGLLIMFSFGTTYYETYSCKVKWKKAMRLEK